MTFVCAIKFSSERLYLIPHCWQSEKPRSYYFFRIFKSNTEKTFNYLIIIKNRSVPCLQNLGLITSLTFLDLNCIFVRSKFTFGLSCIISIFFLLSFKYLMLTGVFVKMDSFLQNLTTLFGVFSSLSTST